MSEFTISHALKKGDKGVDVKKVQEWLCLSGISLKVDSQFGEATEAAVEAFQKSRNFGMTGVVDDNTFAALSSPMRMAVAEIDAQGKAVGEMVVVYAKQHLELHPREVGGANCGPWVRLYLDGHEGVSWYWCAGFVCFVLKQACQSLGMPMPIAPTFSCDNLAIQAIQKEIYLKEPPKAGRAKITAGSLFLNRRSTNDWNHTGIVLDAEAEVFHTIEGNTNDGGSSDGYEVCQRIRGYKGKDFVLIG